MSPIQGLSDLLKSQYCPTCGTICTPSGRQVDHIKKKKCGNKASGKVQYTSCDIVFISTSGILRSSDIYKIVFQQVKPTMNLYYLYCVKKGSQFRMPTIKNWARIRALKLRRA